MNRWRWLDINVVVLGLFDNGSYCRFTSFYVVKAAQRPTTFKLGATKKGSILERHIFLTDGRPSRISSAHYYPLRFQLFQWTCLTVYYAICPRYLDDASKKRSSKFIV